MWETRTFDETVEPGDEYDFTFDNPYDNRDIVIDGDTSFSFYNWDHQHPPDPGVVEFANETASNVDVLVNGTEEVTNIGSGEFETTVDLADTLTDGQFNQIELASDTLGLLIASIGIRAYEQIGGSN